LTFKQNKEGLLIDLPQVSFQDMAYVLRLRFTGSISALKK